MPQRRERPAGCAPPATRCALPRRSRLRAYGAGDRRSQQHPACPKAPRSSSCAKPCNRSKAGDYSFDFYRWRKAFELKKHYQVHTKQVCPRDSHRISYAKSFGTARRRAFFCTKCQRLVE